MTTTDTIAVVGVGVPLVLSALRLVHRLGQLVQTIDTLVGRVDELRNSIESESVQRRASDAELHDRIDGLLTPRPGRIA